MSVAGFPLLCFGAAAGPNFANAFLSNTTFEHLSYVLGLGWCRALCRLRHFYKRIKLGTLHEKISRIIRIIPWVRELFLPLEDLLPNWVVKKRLFLFDLQSSYTIYIPRLPWIGDRAFSQRGTSIAAKCNLFHATLPARPWMNWFIDWLYRRE